MPSTRRQKAKARKTREMDMMSDCENMDVLLGNENTKPSERELSVVVRNLENHCDIESNSQFRGKYPQEDDLGHYVHGNGVPGHDWLQETLETFTSEFNMRLSQEIDSMMSMMHTQINIAIPQL